MHTAWHFPIMIFVSLIVFLIMIRIVIGKREYIAKRKLIYLLSIVVVVLGMLFGKYGANWGLKWWIYYPIPLLMNVLLPPILLKMNSRKTLTYLGLSFLSAPLIHFLFSTILGWTEYMPFWDI
jgi:hypothetical protein